MQLIDKILLALLIVLLPIGLILTQVVMKPKAKTNQNEPKEEVAAIEKLANSISSIGSAEPKSEKEGGIEVTAVYLATESATLNVAGTAEKSSMAVHVSTTILPSSAGAAEIGEENEGVLGSLIEQRSFLPKTGGTFIFPYDVTGKTGIVEIRLEQGEDVETVQFDIENNSRVF